MAKLQHLAPALALALAACGSPQFATQGPAPSANIRIELGRPVQAYRLAMQIGIQSSSLGGFNLDVEPADTIDNVKAKIQELHGTDPATITLSFQGTSLLDNKTLSDYSIQKESVLLLTVAQTGVHRWVPEDVWEYRVVLRRESSPGQWADFSTPLVVVVPLKDGQGTRLAQFQSLSAGQRYQASLEAWGNRGGTAATERLNAKTPTQAVFDFTASNDVVAQQSATLTATLDGVPFSGQGSLSFGSPAPGVFVQPSDNPAVSVGQTPS